MNSPFPPQQPGQHPPWPQQAWEQQQAWQQHAVPPQYPFGVPLGGAPQPDTRAPIPLPPEAVPSGTRPWTTAAAHLWAAIRAPRWTTPYVPVAAIVVGVVGLGSLPVDSACDSNAGECGPEWVLYVLLGGLLLAVAALFAQPVLAVVGAFIGLGLALVLYPPRPEDIGATWPWWLLLVGLAWAVVTSAVRVTRVRDQRYAAEEAAGAVSHAVPAAVLGRTVQRAVLRLVFGLGALVLSGLCVWGLLDAFADDRAHARRADRVWATIVDVDDTTATVRVDGEAENRVSEGDDYEREEGDRVGVLVDGDWTRLADERFDGITWWLGILVCIVPGLMLTTGALRVRRRARRLRPGGAAVATLRVQVLFVDNQTVQVYADDDEARGWPLFRTKVEYWATPFGAYPPSPGPEGVDLAKKAATTSAVPQYAYTPMWHPTPWRPRACAAVLFGPPYAGAEFVMLVAREQDTPCVAVSARAVRPLRTAGARPPKPPGH
ncbi:hypothetical protein OG216_03605 [Streptomycetaceae bacterium NBC_01309]